MNTHTPHHEGTVYTYILGYLSSLTLTLVAFVLVEMHVRTGHLWGGHMYLAGIIVLLAIGQLILQAYTFLHLGDEPKPRWNSIAFIYTLCMVVFVVLGSLWIMNNLNYYMMTPMEIDHHMLEQ